MWTIRGAREPSPIVEYDPMMHDKHAVLRRKASCCSGAVVRVHDQLWAGTPARRARVFDVRRRSRAYPSEYSTCTGPRGPRDHHVKSRAISAPTGAGRRRDEPAVHQDRGSRPGCRAGGTAWVCASRDRDRGRACGFLGGEPGAWNPYLGRPVVGLTAVTVDPSNKLSRKRLKGSNASCIGAGTEFT